MLFEEGAASNEKCYVVLSGKVGVFRHIKEEERPPESEDLVFSDQAEGEEEEGEEDEDQDENVDEERNFPTDRSRNSISSFFSTSQRNIKRSPSIIRKSSRLSQHAYLKKGIAKLIKKSATFKGESNNFSPYNKKNSTIIPKRKNSEKIGLASPKLRKPPGTPTKFSKFGQNFFKLKRMKEIKEAFIRQPKNPEVPVHLEKKVEKYGKFLASIGPGNMFGQVALMSNNPRNASIFALADTEFMTLRQQEFDIIKKYYNKEFSQRREFISTVFTNIEKQSTDDQFTKFLQFFVPLSYDRVKFVSFIILGKNSC